MNAPASRDETSRRRHASATSLVSNADTSHTGCRAVLEEQLDPRPQPEQFARIIAARAIAAGSGTDRLAWLRGWNDREGDWTNLRNIEHWIDRAHG
jgi:hypothetical protein